MTKYQIPSEPSPNTVTPPANNSPSEVNVPNWESRMAKLVGLEESHSQEEDSATRQSALQTDPQEVQSRSPISSNPFAKLGLVGAGTLAAVVFAGVFLTQLIGGGNKTSHQNRNVVLKDTRSQSTTKPISQQQAEEIETLKTKLALSQQAQAVEAAQQQLRNQKLAPSPQAIAKPTPQLQPRVIVRDRPTVVVPRTPTPVQTVYAPPRTLTQIVRVPQPVRVQPPARVVAQPVRIPQRVVSTPKVQPTLPVIPPSTAPSVAPTPSPTPDPLQQWSKLAKLGSYGQVSNATTAPQSVPNPTATAQRLAVTIPQPPSRIQSPPSPAANSNSKSTVVGSSAKAVLVTAVYGETTRANNSYSNNRNNRNNNSNNNNNSNDSSNDSGNKDVFVARLTEPLKAADGSVILPKETQVFFYNDSTSDSGLMKLNVFKVSWKENNNVIEKSVPQGNLVIRGSSSQPTVAQQHQPKTGGSRFGSDIQLGLLGGVGKATEYVNRPNQKLVTLPTTTNTNGTITTTSSTAIQNDEQRNIGAGLLEGATKAVVPELQRRIQQQNIPRPTQTNVWTMAAGKQVELFVNGSIPL